jgi:hypothetical protein
MAGFLFLALAAGSPIGAAPAPQEVVIRGRVTDQSGAPMAGQPVRLIKTKTTLKLLKFETGTQQAEQARTETDADGRYEFRLAPDPNFDYFYLRFYDPKSFDPVRYMLPADQNITKPFKSRPEVLADVRIADHPGWATVKDLVARYGEGSNRGRLLRQLGLPEKRETVSEGSQRENWWYYAKGLCYQLRADEVLRIRRFDPVLPPSRSS